MGRLRRNRHECYQDKYAIFSVYREVALAKALLNREKGISLQLLTNPTCRSFREENTENYYKLIAI
jgi:hypothetical protein